MRNPYNRGSAPGRARASSQRPGSFKPGHRKVGGRRKGTRNKLGRDVKRALLAAATLIGDNGAGRRGAVGYFTLLAKCDPKLFYTELWIRLVDIEAYDAARGHRTPREDEIDCEESADERIRRWEIQFSHVPEHLKSTVELYIAVAVVFPKLFVRLFAAAFLTPPRGWQSRLRQRGKI